jgi:hypothetical protein
MPDNRPRLAETTSHRYGNNKTIDEVFDKEHCPIDGELEDALADTAHLSEKEAYAFAHGHFGQLPVVHEDEDLSNGIPESAGFESTSEFTAAKEAAKEKIADAIWIYELIDAFRRPDFPEECTDCGRDLGGMWVEEDDVDGYLCRDCADVNSPPL